VASALAPAAAASFASNRFALEHHGVTERPQHRHAAAAAGDVNLQPRVSDQRDQSLLIEAADEMLIQGGDAAGQIAAPDQHVGVGCAGQHRGRRVRALERHEIRDGRDECLRWLRGPVDDRQPRVDPIPGAAEHVVGHRPHGSARRRLS
jgi:hypothetical protein